MIRAKYNKYFNKHLYHNVKCKSTIFDKLPGNIQHKILKFLDKFSLIRFSQAYPKHIKTICNPIYWAKFEDIIDSTKINTNEYLILLNHVNCHLKLLNLDLNSLRQKRVELLMNYLFSECTSLRQLILRRTIISSRLIANMCLSLKQLQSLTLDYDNVENKYIILMTVSLHHLSSLFIRCSNNPSQGFAYYLKNSKKVTGFGLMTEKASYK